MSYIPGIPNANDLISSSQSQIQTNFTQLNTQFAIDHVAFDAGANNGKHKQITLENVAAPGAQTDPQSVIYSKLATGGVLTAYSLPFFRNQSGELPLAPDLSNTGTNYGYQQGNLIYNFGSGTILQGTQSLAITWKIPFVTAVLSVLMTKNGSGLGSSGNTNTCNATATSLLQGTFTAQSSLTSGNMPFFYLAIGY